MEARGVVLPLLASVGLVALAVGSAVGLNGLIGKSDGGEDTRGLAASAAPAPADFCASVVELRDFYEELTDPLLDPAWAGGGGLTDFAEDENPVFEFAVALWGEVTTDAEEAAALDKVQRLTATLRDYDAKARSLYEEVAAGIQDPELAESVRQLFEHDDSQRTEEFWDFVAQAKTRAEIRERFEIEALEREQEQAQWREQDIAAANATWTAFDEYVQSECGFSLTPGGSSSSSNSVAKADVSTLGKEIATYFVDWEEGQPLPTVSVDEGVYVLPNGVTAPVSPGVELGVQIVNSPTDWCVSTLAAETGAVYSYSSQRGLAEGACIPSDG